MIIASNFMTNSQNVEICIEVGMDGKTQILTGRNAFGIGRGCRVVLRVTQASPNTFQYVIESQQIFP